MHLVYRENPKEKGIVYKGIERNSIERYTHKRDLCSLLWKENIKRHKLEKILRKIKVEKCQVIAKVKSLSIPISCETVKLFPLKLRLNLRSTKKNLLEMTSYELFLSFFYNIITRFFFDLAFVLFKLFELLQGRLSFDKHYRFDYYNYANLRTAIQSS